MTPLENFQRMMRRDHPAWLPFDLPMTAPVVQMVEAKLGGRNYHAEFKLDFARTGAWNLGEDPKQWQAAVEALRFVVPEKGFLGGMGTGFVEPPMETLGKATHLREWLHPLSVVTEVKQLEDLPWPDVRRAEPYAHLPAAVAAAHLEGRPIIAGQACTIFEIAWYARGMDNLFMDLIERNGIGDWLLDWHMQRSIAACMAYAKAGVDAIELGDDVGTQRGMLMSVEFWRTHLKPRLAQVIRTIRAHEKQHTWIKYHSDGDVRDIADDLAEIGVEILNPLQPECMAPEEIIPRHQHHLGFWGMVGTQTTMPFGTPADVRQVVADCARWARRGAAIVVAPTHVLEPDVPWENIVALVEAVRGVRLLP